jgi:hypothetical protein
MNYQTFLLSNALGSAMTETGDVAPVAVAPAAAAVPTAPVFALTDFLPAIESEKKKTLLVGFLAGGVVVGGIALVTRRKKSGKR